MEDWEEWRDRERRGGEELRGRKRGRKKEEHCTFTVMLRGERETWCAAASAVCTCAAGSFLPLFHRHLLSTYFVPACGEALVAQLEALRPVAAS